LQRKLTLTVTTVLASVALGGAAGQTAQASSKSMLHHPSSIVRGLLCIHHYEGSWADDGAPYWGGLQMDKSFQKTYGWFRTGKHKEHKWYFVDRWGTADKWPVWAQLVAGIHAYFSRGWNPWPNTARSCGLA
jgi:hypothetical protein